MTVPSPRLLRPACLAAVIAAAAPGARANDGFGGLDATGLEFSRTDAVAMESEDLFIGIDRIRVDYVFRNVTGQDVGGEVIFPLPPVSLWEMRESMMNLPEPPLPDNLVDFRASVDGMPVDVAIDRIAVIEPPWDEDRPPAAQYDTPGRDVTAELARLGLPLTLDADAVVRALLALGPEARAAVQAAGLAEYFAAYPDEGIPESVEPAWSVVLRYHWTQVFPAGQELRVRHEYRNSPPGGIFYWEHPIGPDGDYLREIAARYCVDDGTSAAMARALRRDDDGTESSYGLAYFLAYVLRTANSWAGPIGSFRLTLDKGDARNVISLCAEGVRKTGPTTFVIEKSDYRPARDLEILIVTPLPD